MQTSELVQSQQESAFSVAELFSFLWLSKFRIIFTSAAIIAAGAHYIYSLPKIYSADTTILLGESEQTLTLPSLAGGFGDSSDSIDTYMEFLRSRQFLGEIIDKNNLIEFPEFRPATPGKSDDYIRNHAIEVVSNNLTLSRVGDTSLLKITYFSRHPNTAYEVANYFGPAFFEYHSRLNRRKADDASKWLNDQLEDMQQELDSAEKSLQDYLSQNQLIDGHSQIDLIRAEISALMNERLAVEKVLSKNLSAMEQISAANGNLDLLMQVPWIISNPLVVDIRAKLIAQEQKLAEVEKRYKYKHHRHIAAVATIDRLKEERQQLLNGLVSGLQQDIAASRQRVAELDEKIAVAKVQYTEQGQQELQLERLRREVDSKQTLYETFMQRLQETEMLKDLEQSEQFVVVDYATLPHGPTKPRVALLTALLAIFAVLASSGFWLFLHLISDRHTRYRALLRKIGVPIIGEVPRLQKRRFSSAKLNVFEEGEKDYQFSEAIRSIRTAILMGGEAEKRIVALTSVNKNAGKATISVSLARSFARLERTMLIDADMRSPSIGKTFEISQDKPGLTHFMSKLARFSDCTHKALGGRLSVIPSGVAPSDPSSLLSTQRFAGAIKKMGILYERLIIAAPSVSPFSDAQIISRYADAVILVCDPEQTDSVDLLEAIQKLQDAGAPLLGVVFNRLKNVRNKVPVTSRTRRLVRKVLRRGAPA